MAGLTTQARERMDGLVSRKDLTDFLTTGVAIIMDLKKDGFEAAEIREYLNRELLIMSKKLSQ